MESFVCRDEMDLDLDFGRGGEAARQERSKLRCWGVGAKGVGDGQKVIPKDQDMGQFLWECGSQQEASWQGMGHWKVRRRGASRGLWLNRRGGSQWDLVKNPGGKRWVA